MCATFNNVASFTATSPGLPTFAATATDAAGNIGTADTRIRIIDPADVTGPFVEIISPTPGEQITYLTDVVGSVIATDIDTWFLEYSLLGTDNWVQIATRNKRVHQPVDSHVRSDSIGQR